MTCTSFDIPSFTDRALADAVAAMGHLIMKAGKINIPFPL